MNDLDLEENVSDLVSIRRQAAEQTAQYQDAQKKRYDLRRRPTQYKIGQYVLMRKTIASNDGKGKKALPNYSGPYVVTKVLSYDRCVIKDLPGAQRAQKMYKGFVRLIS